MGFKSFYARERAKKKEMSKEFATIFLGKAQHGPNVEFNRDGSIKSITTSKGKVFNLTQRFAYYIGHKHQLDHRASGAYVFRPEKQIPEFFDLNHKQKPSVHSGAILDEIQVSYGPYVGQSVRIYHDGTGDVEFDWVVGPIPVEDQKAKVFLHAYSFNRAIIIQFLCNRN